MVGVFPRLQQGSLGSSGRHVQQAFGVADAGLQALHAFVFQDGHGLAGRFGHAATQGNGAAQQRGLLAGAVDGGAHPADGGREAPAQRLLHGGGQVVQLDGVAFGGGTGGAGLFQCHAGFVQALLQPVGLDFLQAGKLLLQLCMFGLFLPAFFLQAGQLAAALLQFSLQAVHLQLQAGGTWDDRLDVGHVLQLVLPLGSADPGQGLQDVIGHLAAQGHHAHALVVIKAHVRVTGLQLRPEFGGARAGFGRAQQQHDGAVGEAVTPAFELVAHGVGRVAAIDQQQVDAAGFEAWQGLGAAHAQQCGKPDVVLAVVFGGTGNGGRLRDLAACRRARHRTAFGGAGRRTGCGAVHRTMCGTVRRAVCGAIRRAICDTVRRAGCGAVRGVAVCGGGSSFQLLQGQVFGLPGSHGTAAGGQLVFGHGLADGKVQVARLGAQLHELAGFELPYQPHHEGDVTLLFKGRRQAGRAKGEHLGKKRFHGVLWTGHAAVREMKSGKNGSARQSRAVTREQAGGRSDAAAAAERAQPAGPAPAARAQQGLDLGFQRLFALAALVDLLQAGHVFLFAGGQLLAQALGLFFGPVGVLLLFVQGVGLAGQGRKHHGHRAAGASI